MADIINVDDFVIIEKKVEKEAGWKDAWVEGMDQYIGTIGRVSHIYPDIGMRICVPSLNNANIFSREVRYNFPLSSLVLL